ncbi:hypothetical protein ACLOJK_036450, partial [Asimina triloba]
MKEFAGRHAETTIFHHVTISVEILLSASRRNRSEIQKRHSYCWMGWIGRWVIIDGDGKGKLRPLLKMMLGLWVFLLALLDGGDRVRLCHVLDWDNEIFMTVGSDRPSDGRERLGFLATMIGSLGKTMEPMLHRNR